MASSSSNHSKKRHGGNKNKAAEMEEIVRHMSNLPSYLERGKPIQDRALNFGVMEWGRLEKWQYHRQKEGVFGNNKYSPSSSNSSLLFSTNASSPVSSKGQSSSPNPLKPDYVTLGSHLNISSEDISTPMKGNIEKSSDVRESSKKKTTNRSRNKQRDSKMNDVNPRNLLESKSFDDCESFQTASSSLSSKGKKKIEDELVTNNIIPTSFPPKTEVVNGKNSQYEADSERNRSILSQSKPRTISPRHRFSFNVSSNATKRAESPPVSQALKTDDTSAARRNHTSPLRRLLDPLFQSKSSYAETSVEDSKVKSKVKLDFGSCKEVKIDDSCRNTKTNESSSTKQAMFQMAIKNGRPLFTFAVDNNADILAATVRSFKGKDDTNNWIYTFFTVQELKKKKSGWLSHSTKGVGQGFLPNVTAQMTVTNPSVSNDTIREFVLSSVGPGRLDHEGDPDPLDELAAMVVRFLRKTEEENRDCFSTTVILPGGHHSVPSKGEPSPLIQRWRSGGVCDCGGWDVGCRLRILTNKVQSDRRSNSSGTFDLFFQGDVIHERPFFSISPLKEGIFSVEYNSSLSLLHAFSICISVIECRKSSQHTQLKTYVAKRVDDDDDDGVDEDEDDDAPVTYMSLPPVSPVGRV